MTNRFFAGQTDYIEQLNALDVETGDHIADTTGAHAATAISNTPAGNIAAATVQAAINELDSEKLSATATTLPASFTASSLTSVGTLTALAVSGQSSFAAGTAAAPSVKVGAGNEGLYSLAAGTLGLTANGCLALRLDTVTNSVNYLYGYANSTGGAPVLRALGSDTNVRLILSSQGTGSVDVFTNGVSVGQFRFNHVANSVNIIQAAGAATGGAPSFAVDGTDTNIPFAYYTKGTGTHRFFANGGLQMLIGAPASSVNYWQFFGAAAAGALNMYADGSDTNIAVVQNSKGTGSHFFRTNGGAQTQFVVSHTASAVNYWSVSGAATGGNLDFIATGSDTNIQGRIFSKGNGKIVFGGEGVHQVRVVPVASAVNTLDLSGSATGNAVTISAAGSDSNIDFAITPKGTGNVRFGAHRDIAAETVTGYITIKDSAGNTRKLAVVS